MFEIRIINYKGDIPIGYTSILDFPYWELLKLEAHIELYIQNILFLTDEYFPILEFLYEFEKWKVNMDDNFEYNSIESAVNPVLSFTHSNEICEFDSIWKLTEKTIYVNIPDVLSGVDHCLKFFKLK